MGEVFKAEDTTLGRPVALKFLGAHLLHDDEAKQRFMREAKAAAVISHPNICTVFEVGEENGKTFLAMDYLEGESLEDRIAKGPLPLADALDIGRQIAEGLEAAHEKGIVHRDIKPANVMVDAKGRATILDFGLARLTEASKLTRADQTVGTAAYMSPEQVQGAEADHRADIWALGCVLYEMVAGVRPFKGQYDQALAYEIVQEEPEPLTGVRAGVPMEIELLVAKCLAKEPGERYRHTDELAADLARLRQAMSGSGPSRVASVQKPAIVAPSPEPGRRWLWPAATGLAVLVAIGALLWPRGSQAPISERSVTFSIVPPEDSPLRPVGGLSSTPEISPDGTSVFYNSIRKIQLRQLDSLEMTSLDFSISGNFWAPDSRSIYTTGSEVVRIPVPDGATEQLFSPDGATRGATASKNGALITSETLSLLFRSSAEADPVALEAPGLDDFGVYPEFLPDGKSFLFYYRDDAGTGKVYLASLEGGRVTSAELLLENESTGRYTPAGGGNLLFVQRDNLYAQRLDIEGRTLAGDARLLIEGVASGFLGRADFSVSDAGDVAWRPGVAALSQVTAFDRKGNVVGTTGPPLPVHHLKLAADDARLLAAWQGASNYMLDADRGGRVELGARPNWRSLSNDGSRVLGVLDGALWEAPVTDLGSPREWGAYTDILQDWSPDGRYVLGKTLEPENTYGFNAYRLEEPFEEQEPIRLGSARRALTPSFSPDGRWILYGAEGGVFVQKFPGPGLPEEVVGIRGFPVWRGDGREIVIVTIPAGQVYSVGVERSGYELEFGEPELLFGDLRIPSGTSAGTFLLAVSSDGSRIYWPQPVEQPGPDVIHVRTNAVR